VSIEANAAAASSTNRSIVRETIAGAIGLACTRTPR
jgi:hypothetical protein